eukprot:TRINITY_DN1695_c0_g1_i1.p1 TRINITY_DN1695_c0_g1~~TRINITY_DN1695_c0_g1_i1.p1  ORF type:complete len:146 (-),score=34.60 TRINITY_DN1695_c0_g1_i1:114-551(-)
MGVGKPKGIRSARKLRFHRKKENWADPQYKKANLGTASKADPFGGASHALGIVLEKTAIPPRQGHFGARKCVIVRLIKNDRKVFAFVPHEGGMDWIDEGDKVLLSGRGRKGRTVGDIPSVHYNVISVARVSLKALMRHKRDRCRI